MYIYKVYKNKKEINVAIQENKLKENYIFAYGKHLYKMIDDKLYQRISYFEYANNALKNQIERISNLKYEEGDIIKITGNYRKNIN